MDVFCKQLSLLHILIAVVNALSRDFMYNIILVQIYNSMKISQTLIAVTNRTTTTLQVMNTLFERDFSYNTYWADMGEERLYLHNEITLNLICTSVIVEWVIIKFEFAMLCVIVLTWGPELAIMGESVCL